MRSGKVLRLERGLAEIEFDRGARVILQGPCRPRARFRDDGPAALRHAHRPGAVRPAASPCFPQRQGCRPRHRIRPVGRRWRGHQRAGLHRLVEAFPLDVRRGPAGVTIHQDQTAQIDGRTVAVDRGFQERHSRLRPRICPCRSYASHPESRLHPASPALARRLRARHRLYPRLPGTGRRSPSAIPTCTCARPAPSSSPPPAAT